jgi:hypothetical protein
MDAAQVVVGKRKATLRRVFAMNASQIYGCPLRPQYRALLGASGTSAKGQKRAFANCEDKQKGHLAVAPGTRG